MVDLIGAKPADQEKARQAQRPDPRGRWASRTRLPTRWCGCCRRILVHDGIGGVGRRRLDRWLRQARALPFLRGGVGAQPGVISIACVTALLGARRCASMSHPTPPSVKGEGDPLAAGFSIYRRAAARLQCEYGEETPHGQRKEADCRPDQEAALAAVVRQSRQPRHDRALSSESLPGLWARRGGCRKSSGSLSPSRARTCRRATDIT